MEWLWGLLGTVGGAIGAGVPLYLKFRGEMAKIRAVQEEAAETLRRGKVDHDQKIKREQSDEDAQREAVQVQQLLATIELLRSDGKEFRQEIHDLRDQLNEVGLKVTKCERERSWLRGWVEANRGAFERAGISYPPELDESVSRAGRARNPPPPSPAAEDGSSG